MLYTVPMHDHEVLMSMHHQLTTLLPTHSELPLEMAMCQALGFEDVSALVCTHDACRVFDTQDLPWRLKAQGVKLSKSTCSLVTAFRFKDIPGLLPYVLQSRGMVSEGPYEPQWTPRDSHIRLMDYLLMGAYVLGLEPDMPRMHSVDLTRMFNGHLQLRGLRVALLHGEVVAAITQHSFFTHWWKPSGQEGVEMPLPVSMFRKSFEDFMEGVFMDVGAEKALEDAMDAECFPVALTL